MAKTLKQIHEHILALAKASPVDFDMSRIREKVIAKRRRPTNQVVYEAMMNGPKFVFVEKTMTPEQLLTTEAGLNKIARLIAPVAWAEYDAAPRGSKPGTKQVSNAAIAEITDSQRAAAILASYVLLHTEPEIGQTPSK